MNRNFIKYVTQSIMTMLGFSIYILTDTFFISVNNGYVGLTALNLILPIYGLIYAVGAMIGIGSATRFTIKRICNEDTSFYFMQSIMWTLVVSIPFIFVGIFEPVGLLKLLGANNEVLDIGVDYARVVLIASPAFMLNYTFTAFARNDNGTSIAMIGSVIGSIGNIVLDYLFIFPLGLGFVGAALATACSPIITIIIVSTHFISKKNRVGFSIKRLMPFHIVKCMAIGFSSFVGEISSGITTMIFNYILLRIAGNVAVAAYGIIANCALVVIAIFNGVAQGIQPIISKNYGKGEFIQNKKIIKKAVKLVCIISTLIIIFSWIFTRELIGVFNSENDYKLFEYAYTGIRIYFLGFIVAGINIVMISFFSATDRATAVIETSLSRGLITISLSAFLLSFFCGINGVWASMLVSEVITFFIISVIYKKIIKV